MSDSFHRNEDSEFLSSFASDLAMNDMSGFNNRSDTEIQTYITKCLVGTHMTTKLDQVSDLDSRDDDYDLPDPEDPDTFDNRGSSSRYHSPESFHHSDNISGAEIVDRYEKKGKTSTICNMAQESGRRSYVTVRDIHFPTKPPTYTEYKGSEPFLPIIQEANEPARGIDDNPPNTRIAINDIRSPLFAECSVIQEAERFSCDLRHIQELHDAWVEEAKR